MDWLRGFFIGNQGLSSLYPQIQGFSVDFPFNLVVGGLG